MAAPAGNKTRWIISATISAIFVGVVIMLFRVPTERSMSRPPSSAKHLLRLSPGRPDELAMRDLAPLFLPTRYNAALGEMRQLEPGATFFERDTQRWRFTEATPNLRLPVPGGLPSSPVDALADMPGPLALAIGRTEDAITPVPASGGHLDVFSADGRNSVFGVALDRGIRPTATGRDSLGWKPLEFAAAVDAAGLVGHLVLTRGSGVEEIDNFFRNYLAGTFRIGDRLPPGFYRIVVGP